MKVKIVITVGLKMVFKAIKIVGYGISAIMEYGQTDWCCDVVDGLYFDYQKSNAECKSGWLIQKDDTSVLK